MLDYRYIKELTDEAGILQFSKLAIPDKRSGYTLDDNARALIVSMYMDEGYQYAQKYIWYIKNSQQKDGSWSNFFLDGRFCSHFDSEDSIGRALLACSLASSAPWPDIADLCQQIYENNIHKAISFRSPRAISYALLAICKGNETLSKQKSELLDKLKEYLFSLYEVNHSSKWLWFENYLTYCNGILPQALFSVYTATGNRKALKIAHDSLNFLNSILFRNDYLNIVGNQGWYQRGGNIGLFDQQPVDAASTVHACFEAYNAIGEPEYLELALKAYQWYRGRNIHGISLYDQNTGACFDALSCDGVNKNRGAEAVLSLLLSDILMENFVEQEKKVDKSS